MALSRLIAAPALLKIFLFLALWLILWLPVAVPLARRLKWNPRESVTPERKIPLVASLYTIAPLALWIVLTVEGSSPIAYGFSINLSIPVGFLLAALGLGIVFAIEGWLGWIAWKPENFTRALTLSLPIALLALWIAITEEFIFRGLFLDWLASDHGYSIAAVVSSVIFALLHLLWERRETLPQLPGLWLLGMVLALARAIDGGSLGLPWGLHAGWVWGLALLDSSELLVYRDRGSPWLKGFYNNPLAGLAGILCLLGTGLGLFFLPQ